MHQSCFSEPFSRETKRAVTLAAKSGRPVRTGADAGLSKKAFAKAATATIPEFPLLSLVISGGHTQIIYMPRHNHFEIIGTTRDDAIGECFDKVAKILGLPYPGGPSIAKCALTGNPQKYPLPHPKIDALDFSFSGLKTAVLRAVQSACNLPITTPSHELATHLSEIQKADFAASFQSTACDILLEKLALALEQYPDVRSLVFAGGVSANQLLREKAQAFVDSYNATIPKTTPLKPSSNPSQTAAEAPQALQKPQPPSHQPSPQNPLLAPPRALSGDSTRPPLKLFFPEPKFTGDNAAMVGAAAFFEITSGVPPTDPYSLSIAPRRTLS